MSLQKFLSQRRETIRKSRAIDIQTKEKMKLAVLGVIDNIETYVPCSSCDWNKGGNCTLDSNNVYPIPDELIPIGCGEGYYDDIPF